MSHRFKRPKEFLYHGNEQARLRKSAQRNIHNQEALDAFLFAMPPQMRDVAFARIKPYLCFEPFIRIEWTPSVTEDGAPVLEKHVEVVSAGGQDRGFSEGPLA